MRVSWILTVPLVALAAACGVTNSDPSPGPAGDDALAASLMVEAGESAVQLALHVTNVSGVAIELSFPTAQRYDFAILSPSGEELWRWSAERTFAQVVGRQVLQPGETLEYEVSWHREPRVAGELVAVGLLATASVDVEQRMEFEVE